MASDLSAYFGNTILRWLANQADMPTRPTNLYIGLFNGNPKGSGTEVGASIKASGPRQEITFAALSAGASHLLTSNIAQDWGNSEGSATISHLALYDNPTPGSGHLYASKAISGGAQLISAGSSVKFNAGAITFNIGADS